MKAAKRATHSHYKNQKNQKNKDYASILAIWDNIAVKMQSTALAAEMQELRMIVIENQDPRNIAKNFFSYGVNWSRGSAIEAVFRSQWKTILRTYKYGDHIDFSWQCLGDISTFMVQFFVYYQDELRRQKNKNYHQSRQRYYQQDDKRKKRRSSSQRQRSAAPRPWYQVLGVSPHASFDEIKKAYRKKMLAYHPDRCANLSERKREETEELAKEVNAAFEEAKSFKGH